MLRQGSWSVVKVASAGEDSFLCLWSIPDSDVKGGGEVGSSHHMMFVMDLGKELDMCCLMFGCADQPAVHRQGDGSGARGGAVLPRWVKPHRHDGI
jgi:hypothetical protein